MIAAHIIERARSVRIEDEIARRGIKLRGGIDRCGSCPVCGGVDRFAINIRKRVFLCRFCQVGGDVIRLVQHVDGCTFAEAIETLTGERAKTPAPPPAAKTKQSVADYGREQHRKARWLWSQRKPISGSIAEHYLREVRKITCPLPPTLGFLPARGEHPPAMIAAFALVDEPEPGVLGELRNVESVHVTLLERDGRDKANVEPNKIIIGSPAALPLVFAPPNDLLGLAISEGIEDGLTAHQALGLGAWAAASASFMPALADAVPSYIEVVTIFAHPDQAGQDGARKLAQALEFRGIEVRVEGII
jgi:hypothetical protein